MNSRLSKQEFELTDSEFDRLRAVVLELTGIALADSKRELLYSRLARRLRKLKMTSFTDYCSMIEAGYSDELQELTNAITTNLTSFFRESYHFEQLATEVLPQIEQERSTVRRMRFWSAGCSTGEEPYSLAMVLRESLAHLTSWDIRLLATDIDSKVIEVAAAGAYETERLTGLSDSRTSRWFTRSATKPAYSVISDELKSLITFKQLNLFDAWPMQGAFDVIFCRNVVIYFDKETQRRLFDRLADLQAPGGWLFIGHSENLFNVTNRYKPVGRTVYRRTE
jgi:chemotaxis protein methyltransferase CheR